MSDIDRSRLSPPQPCHQAIFPYAAAQSQHSSGSPLGVKRTLFSGSFWSLADLEAIAQQGLGGCARPIGHGQDEVAQELINPAEPRQLP